LFIRRSENGDDGRVPAKRMKDTASRSEIDRRLLDVVGRSVDEGTALPGEPTLASLLGVSRPTLREALARLERDGVLHRRQGSQTFVNRAALELVGRFDQVADFSDVLRDAGFKPGVEVLVEERIRLKAEAAAAFDVAVGTPALRIVKRWMADGRPVRLAIDELPLPSEAITLKSGRSVLDLVPQLAGERVVWELAMPGAVNANREMSGWLDVAPRTALLMLECLGISQSGARVYRALDHYVPWAVRLGLIRTIPDA
jgi:GntR family transcriptional regulator